MTDWVTQVIDAMGYVGLALLMLLECVFPPIPSEVILPFAGFVIAEGGMSFPLAVLSSTAGSLAGALVLYAIAQRGGRPLVARHGHRLGAGPERLERLEAWMERWGAPTVLVGRFVPLARSAVSLPAGLARFPLWKFTLLTAVGSALWNAGLIGLGWALDESWRSVEERLGPASTVIGVVIVLALAALAVLGWRRARRGQVTGS
ncbi:MAG: DedA family protein [Thermoleophilia bacterium]